MQFTDLITPLTPPTNNIILKTTSSETIIGTLGNDSIDGKGGSDFIDGDAGVDTVVFFGSRADFTVIDLSGVVRVTGLSTFSIPASYRGATTELQNIEKVQFLDKTITLDGSGVSTSTTYSLSPASTSIGENTSSQSFTITRSGDLVAETVYVSTVKTEGFDNNGDYKSILNQPVQFGSSETSAVVTVDIIDDSISEQDETFGLIVQRDPNVSAPTFIAKSTFTITDDDDNTSQEIKTTTDNIIVAAANLSRRAYSDIHHKNQSDINEINTNIQSWTPLKSTDLGFSMEDERFSTIDESLLRYDFENASATVGLTILEGKRTLGISFEGTNAVLSLNGIKDLIQDAFAIQKYYDSLIDFHQAVFNYIFDGNNNIDQVLVTGHSLGGAAAQNFMFDYGHLNSKFIGVTFGSPGTNNSLPLPEDRFVNFQHGNDPVPKAGEIRGYELSGAVINTSTAEDSGHSLVNYKKTVDFITSQMGADVLFRDLSFNIGTNGVDQLFDGSTRENEIFLGGDGSDTLTSFLGTDQIFIGGKGDDVIKGGPGIDTAIYTAPRSEYVLSQLEQGHSLADQRTGSNNEGNDTLNSIERIIFTDSALALDLDKSAGIVAKLIGAVFGAESVSNANFVGIGLSELDKGTTYEDLASLAIAAAGAQTNEQVVDLLYANLTGTSPTQSQSNPFVNELDNGVYTKGSLGVIAAEHSINQANIDLVGLKDRGILFDPLDFLG